MKFVGNEKIVGEFALSKSAYYLLSGCTFVLIGINIYSIFTIEYSSRGYIIIFIILLAYFIFILIVIRAKTHRMEVLASFEGEQVEIEEADSKNELEMK